MSGSGVELLLFVAQGGLFCVPLGAVRRIVPLPLLRPVPGAPAYLQGVMNLAGECLPVVDLARRLGIERTAPYCADTPLLVCAGGGERGALAVDEVLGVIEAQPGDAQLDALFAGGLPAFAATVRTARGLALELDLPRVLTLDLGLAASDLSIPDSLLAACRAAGAAEPIAKEHP